MDARFWQGLLTHEVEGLQNQKDIHRAEQQDEDREQVVSLIPEPVAERTSNSWGQVLPYRVARCFCR